jgi:hypothetical protein
VSLDVFLFLLVVKDGIVLELDIFLFSLSQLDLGLFFPTKNEKKISLINVTNGDN